MSDPRGPAEPEMAEPEMAEPEMAEPEMAAVDPAGTSGLEPSAPESSAAGNRTAGNGAAEQGATQAGSTQTGATATAPTGEHRPVGELDPVIHAQARLRVVVALSVLREGDRLAFPRLQELLGMTAGNLSVHLRKLEEAGYIEVTKTHHGRTPTTLVCLTRRGRLAFEEYTATLQALLSTGGIT